MNNLYYLFTKHCWLLWVIFYFDSFLIPYVICSEHEVQCTGDRRTKLEVISSKQNKKLLTTNSLIGSGLEHQLFNSTNRFLKQWNFNFVFMFQLGEVNVRHFVGQNRFHYLLFNWKWNFWFGPSNNINYKYLN